MARATAAETSDRIDALQGMILEGEPNNCMSQLCETAVGYLPSTGLQAPETCPDSDHGRCWWNRYWSAWTTGLVNTDADVRGWSGKTTEQLNLAWFILHPVARQVFIGCLTAYPDGAVQLDLGGGGLLTDECVWLRERRSLLRWPRQPEKYIPNLK